jgi:hypothetical protein
MASFDSQLAQRIFSAVLVGAVALPLTACLTIRRGSTQIISIESPPPDPTPQAEGALFP